MSGRITGSATCALPGAIGSASRSRRNRRATTPAVQPPRSCVRLQNQVDGVRGQGTTPERDLTPTLLTAASGEIPLGSENTIRVSQVSASRDRGERAAPGDGELYLDRKRRGSRRRVLQRLRPDPLGAGPTARSPGRSNRRRPEAPWPAVVDAERALGGLRRRRSKVDPDRVKVLERDQKRREAPAESVVGQSGVEACRDLVGVPGLRGAALNAPPFTTLPRPAGRAAGGSESAPLAAARRLEDPHPSEPASPRWGSDPSRRSPRGLTAGCRRLRGRPSRT
jgi:hypothetical protein